MKILCLSDLHLTVREVQTAIELNKFSSFSENIRQTAQQANADVIVVTGDTVSANQVSQLTDLLEQLLPKEIPVVATLGNHEFWGRTFEQTLTALREQTVDSSRIHYLDLDGSFQTGGVNFVGGTLFFDGSLRYSDAQNVSQWNGWQDWRILEIESRYMEFNAYYVDLIRASMKRGMATALCTHHVPHRDLNAFSYNMFSFYTGMADLVSELPFDPNFSNALICGHTHKRIIGEAVPGFQCVNVGSDYGKLDSYILEL